MLLAAARLHAAMAGRILVRTDFRIPQMATVDLSGQRVVEWRSRGKHLLMRTDAALTLHSHLEMDGRWHLARDGRRPRVPPHWIRVIAQTDPWTAVGSRVGQLKLLRTDGEEELLGYLGPDVLGSDWDLAEVVRRLTADPGREIGVALIDQRVMAGPGNVYKSEAMFLRGIHPRALVGSIEDPAALADVTRRIMLANRDRTGPRVTTGDTRPGRNLWVYGRGGEACRRCGTPIRSLEQGPGSGSGSGSGSGERITYFCPRCQPEG